jgi:hypothetical protein
MGGIQVKENVSVIEAVSALMGQEVEMANAYQVYAKGGWDDKFYGVEQTNICMRNLKQIFGDCAPWTLDIFYREGMGNEKAFHLDRPFSCTCACINKPFATMTDVDGNVLGSIGDKSGLCTGLTFDITDPDGNTALTMSSGCCPIGFYCPFPWCPTLRDINMPITDTDGTQVGMLTKRVPSMFKFLFAPDVDNYHVDWEGVEAPELRALLMATTMFIDFRYFNDNTNDEGRLEKMKDRLTGGDGEGEES